MHHGRLLSLRGDALLKLDTLGGAPVFGEMRPSSKCNLPEKAFCSVVEVGLVFMCITCHSDTRPSMMFM